MFAVMTLGIKKDGSAVLARIYVSRTLLEGRYPVTEEKVAINGANR